MKQGTAEWHKARIGKLTGSRAGAALGVNPYQTPDDLIRAMVREYHGAEPEFTGNVATAHGEHSEPLAALDYMSETNQDIVECGFFVHPEHNWLGASPDGLVATRGLVEIKCPFSLRKDKPPHFKTLAEQPHYYAQIQVQMACTGRRWTDFYQWTPHGSSCTYVLFDDDWWKKNLPLMWAFYERYLSELNNPAHLEPLRKIVTGWKYEKLLERYDALKQTQDDAKAEMQDIMAELIAAAGDQSAEICGRKLTRIERKGSVSYAKALAVLAPDADLSQWTGKPGVSWRLT